MMILAGTLTLLLASLPSDDQALSSRELTAIAEEQELLQRQLQRLRKVMEVLSLRLEAEGRPRAVELLRSGLGLLDERNQKLEGSTLEEVMGSSQSHLSDGRIVQSLESQQQIVGKLEQLLAILMERENLDSLEENIAELKDLQAELESLSSQESDLREKTQALHERSANQAQRSLLEGLEDALQEERALLAETERLGRESGAMELELLEDALRSLLENQAVDQSLFEAWQPGEREALQGARATLDEAREAEARAARLGEAAQLLRESAAEIASGADRGPVQEDLEEAAAKEQRHARASQDPAAQRAAESLEEGAQAARDGGASAEERGETARHLEGLAEELEAEAAAERERAGEARRETAADLRALEGGDTPGGMVAEETRQALEEAERAASGASPSDRERARQATEQASRALERGSEELRVLPRALSASQTDNAESAERLARGLRSVPELEEGLRDDAEASLQEAAEAMREASNAAREEDADAASEAARRAERALEDALEEVAAARSAQAQNNAEALAELGQRQGQLGADSQALESQAQAGNMSPEARQAVQESLENAQRSMDQAQSALEEGRSAAAAEAQREAVRSLGQAQEAASGGVRPETPEGQEEARRLAEEQEGIEERIRDLERRNEERDGAEPLPSLERAQESAQEARTSLERGDLDQAQREEEEVEQALEEALEELREEEDQYQQLRQEELLFRIAEELNAMLETHREQLDQTLQIADQRSPGAPPSRSQKLRLRRIAREEGSLGERAAELADAIEAEGTLVFAAVLRQIQDDLERIAYELDEGGDYRTDERTLGLQEDVADALIRLEEALREEQRRREREEQDSSQSMEQDQGQQDGENRLVPKAAELKLLRRMQLDVQDGLEQMLLLYPELDSDEVDPLILEDVQRLATRHERTTELFAQFRERLGLPDPDRALQDLGIEDE